MKFDLDKMVADAQKRIQQFINRAAAQQKRQMVASWKAKK